MAGEVGKGGGFGYEDAQDPEAYVAPVLAKPFHGLEKIILNVFISKLKIKNCMLAQFYGRRKTSCKDCDN
jgi:hypothetical protein